MHFYIVGWEGDRIFMVICFIPDYIFPFWVCGILLTEFHNYANI